MPFNPFPPRQPVHAARLPLTLMTLEDWAVATISGPDSEKYLQGQVTADITQLAESAHTLAAHCDAKGKMWSTLRLFREQDGFAWLLRRSVCETQLKELKKYAVFSKATISDNKDAVLLGIAGLQARAALASLFSVLPDEHAPVVRDGNTTLLWFPLPEERFLVITDAVQAQTLDEKLAGQAQRNNSQQWLALDIEAGLPVIDLATSNEFIPQAVNLQALGGISFKKGCYTGQETVARAKFRGANKRALWLLVGKSGRTPDVAEDLEMKMGDNWRRTGCLLASVALDDGTLLVQAVLNNDLEADTVFRVRDEENSTLHLADLPYSLEEPQA